MKRIIKFRAWNPLARQMFSGHTAFLFHGNDGLEGKVMWKGQDVDQVIMQFTGLLDRNGREIYEGDVVKCSRYTGRPGQFSRHIGKVVYDTHNGAFRICGVKQYEGISCEMNSRPLEVLGNIHENADLLAPTDGNS